MRTLLIVAGVVTVLWFIALVLIERLTTVIDEPDTEKPDFIITNRADGWWFFCMKCKDDDGGFRTIEECAEKATAHNGSYHYE